MTSPRLKALLVCAGLLLFATPAHAALPTGFRWSSSAQLISPKSDATHDIRAVKDPSVYYNGRWHVFAGPNVHGGHSWT